MKKQHLHHHQFFAQPIDLKALTHPDQGWIRTLRKALGMSGPQLATRLGVSKSQVSQMERMEQQDRITLKQLRRVAELLGCDLIYALVPKQPLDDIIQQQARLKATETANKTGENIELEIQRLISKMPRNLWDSSEPKRKTGTEQTATLMIADQILPSKVDLQKLATDHFIKRLILFGPAAKGELTPETIIDLMVEFRPGQKPSTGAGLSKLQKALSSLLQGHEVRLSPRSLLSNPTRRREIEKTMIELYAD